VDTGVLPKILAEAVKGGKVDLGDVKTTMELLKADAVVGPKYPITGSLPGSCAPAVSGHDAPAKPPRRVMNSRRLMCFPQAEDRTIPRR